MSHWLSFLERCSVRAWGGEWRSPTVSGIGFRTLGQAYYLGDQVASSQNPSYASCPVVQAKQIYTSLCQISQPRAMEIKCCLHRSSAEALHSQLARQDWGWQGEWELLLEMTTWHNKCALRCRLNILLPQVWEHNLNKQLGNFQSPVDLKVNLFFPLLLAP